MTKATSFRLALAYGAICIIWGSTYLAIKVGLESFDPFFYAGMRYALAALIMVPYAWWRGASFAGPLSRWLPVFVVGVSFIAVCNGLVFWSETRLDSGFTALLLTTNVVWSALLSPLFPSERAVGPLGWAGIAVGLAGTVVLLAPWESTTFELVAGIAVEVSVVVWTATALWVRRLGRSFDPLALNAVQMAAGAVVLLAVAGARGTTLVGPVTPRSLAGLAFLVVFGSCVAFGAYFLLLQHWDATKVATSTYINPVVALALGAVILGERITPRIVAGAVVVLAGVTLVLQEQRAAQRPRHQLGEKLVE